MKSHVIFHCAPKNGHCDEDDDDDDAGKAGEIYENDPYYIKH